MAPMGGAAYVATTVRLRARAPARASMPHASRGALMACRPWECAGAEIFDILRSAATARCLLSWSMPTPRGRQRRQPGPSGERRFTTSLCSAGVSMASSPHRSASGVRGHQWPPVARDGWYQCWWWANSHLDLWWQLWDCFTRRVPWGALELLGRRSGM